MCVKTQDLKTISEGTGQMCFKHFTFFLVQQKNVSAQVKASGSTNKRERVHTGSTIRQIKLSKDLNSGARILKLIHESNQEPKLEECALNCLCKLKLDVLQVET